MKPLPCCSSQFPGQYSVSLVRNTSPESRTRTIKTQRRLSWGGLSPPLVGRRPESPCPGPRTGRSSSTLGRLQFPDFPVYLVNHRPRPTPFLFCPCTEGKFQAILRGPLVLVHVRGRGGGRGKSRKLEPRRDQRGGALRQCRCTWRGRAVCLAEDRCLPREGWVEGPQITQTDNLGSLRTTPFPSWYYSLASPVPREDPRPRTIKVLAGPEEVGEESSLGRVPLSWGRGRRDRQTHSPVVGLLPRPLRPLPGVIRSLPGISSLFHSLPYPSGPRMSQFRNRRSTVFTPTTMTVTNCPDPTLTPLLLTGKGFKTGF